MPIVNDVTGVARGSSPSSRHSGRSSPCRSGSCSARSSAQRAAGGMPSSSASRAYGSSPASGWRGKARQHRLDALAVARRRRALAQGLDIVPASSRTSAERAAVSEPRAIVNVWTSGSSSSESAKCICWPSDRLPAPLACARHLRRAGGLHGGLQLNAVSIVWFRRDLRLDDHARSRGRTRERARRLRASCWIRSCCAVRAWARRSWQFFFDALAELRERLRRRGSDLALLEGDPLAELGELIRAGRRDGAVLQRGLRGLRARARRARDERSARRRYRGRVVRRSRVLRRAGSS